MGDGPAAIVRSRVSALSTVRTVRICELYSTEYFGRALYSEA